MINFFKWFLLFVGIGVIIGTVIFGTYKGNSVPAGVDLGLEIYYFIAIIVGGLFIYLSTTFSGKQDQ